MALYNFPDSPSNADTVTINGITYTYNSTKAYWTSSAGSSGSGGGASVSTSDSAPSSPSDGDLWYDTDDGGMFVYYADGSSNQWVEVVGQQGSAGAAGADGSATVVANVTALLALSSPAAGDQAFVTATNTLYFYNGSGWYKIALINTTPSISGAASSYDLAINGTATTVTITASDPEGLPITYSIASDTSGNIATVAQGTGSSTNVWTITPSTNNAHAGTFSLTFRASDGVNIATAASSFTLQFKVVNSKYTTALITSVGANNADNNNFLDSSSNTHTITANGDAHQTTFSPYRHGGYSTYFDGTGDYLETPTDTSAFQVGTGQFTLECWFKVNADTQYTLLALMSGSTNVLNIFYYNTNDSIGVVDSGYLTGNVGSGTNHDIIDLNKWYHLALVRDASTIYLYIDGALKYSASNSTNYANNRIRIGANQYGNNLNGYIRDVRFVKGTAVYTSAFTAPTDPLTAVTNTKLLTCHLPYIADGSTDGHAITVAGDPTIEPVSPYDYNEYAAAENLGSIELDGTGDYLVASSNSTTIGTGDFTVDYWVYRTATGGTWQAVVGQRSSGVSNTTMFVSGIHSTGYSYLYSSAHHVASAAGSVPLKRWTHIAHARESGTLRQFVNGALITSASMTNDLTYAPIQVGGAGNGSELFTGIVSEPRIVVGTAVYTAAYTPPTAPVSTVSGTNLHIKGTNAGIIDKSQSSKKVKLVGNTKSSTTQYKFLSSAMYFDGTGDYITLSDQSIGNFGTEDFSVEGWLWIPNNSALYTVVDGRLSSLTDAGGWSVAVNTSGALYVYAGGFLITGASSAVTASTWHHWAYTRASGTHKLFLNGTQTGSSSTTARTYTSQLFTIGASQSGGEVFNGYQSDVRVTKGLARYTANFTAPTAALKG